MTEPIGPHGSRPWPPTTRETAHDPGCTHKSGGPGGNVCRDGCEAYIEQVEAYWEGYDEGHEDGVLAALNREGISP